MCEVSVLIQNYLFLLNVEIAHYYIHVIEQVINIKSFIELVMCCGYKVNERETFSAMIDCNPSRRLLVSPCPECGPRCSGWRL